MSQTLIGLTIVSIGTSLPELVTSIVAARKNEIGMALGNAIGSNVFNFLMVLGIASAISPIAFITENIIDIAILLAFTLLVWLFAATKRRLSRPEGIMMLALYAAYAVYIFIR
jgi:cation:H+ antiporter